MGKTSVLKYARNKNILVICGSGSGKKTRFFVNPNLMQMHSIYVINDLKGILKWICVKQKNRRSNRHNYEKFFAIQIRNCVL